MTERDLEAELQRAFERTAAELDSGALSRLRARAHEIPARSPHMRRWLGLALLAAALTATAAGVLVMGAIEPEPRAPLTAPPSAVALAQPATVEPASSAREFARAPVARASEDALEFEELVNEDALDELAFDPSDLRDAELEAWILAADQELGG